MRTAAGVARVFALCLALAAPAAAGAADSVNERILYVVNPGGAYELRTIEPDGSDPVVARTLEFHEQGYPTAMTPFTLSPGGDGIAYLAHVEDEARLRQQIVHAPLYGDGDEVRSELGHYMPPSYSPAGDKLVFGERSDDGVGAVSELDLGTTEKRELGRVNWGSLFPEYTADGRSVLFWDPGPIASQGHDGLFALSVADGTRTRVTPETIVSFDVAPDGSELVFVSPESLRVLDIESGKVRDLMGPSPTGGTHYTYNSPHYSPAGDRIVFSFHETYAQKPVTQLATVGADGTGFEVVPETEHGFSPDWGAAEPPASVPPGDAKGPVPGADNRVVRPRLSAKRVQRMSRRRPVVRVFVGAAESGRGRAVGRIRGAGRPLRVSGPPAPFEAGERSKVRLSPATGKAARRLRAAIARDRQLTVRVSAWITDDRGNRVRKKMRIELV